MRWRSWCCCIHLPSQAPAWGFSEIRKTSWQVWLRASPSTGTALDSFTSFSPIEGCVCTDSYLHLSIIPMESASVWCLKMTILYECHVCIKKFLKLLCNSHWASVKSFNKDKIKSFIQSNLEGKQQEKKKFGDCWQLLFPPGEISIQSHGQALF